MKKVLLGMSGGVDSSVSALLLKNQGYEVIGITLKLLEDSCDDSTCCGLDAVNDAKRICNDLGIEHHTIRTSMEPFKKYVIDYFIENYKNLKTPNPCIECNKYLKFGMMAEIATQMEADYIATGHYAKTEYSEKYNRIVLKKSSSIKKDQSYVLYSINKEIISKILFPLEAYESKEEIRKIARENNIRVANKPDSEDICFIPDGDYKTFLEKNSNISKKTGKIVDKNGNILGEHEGLYRYTIGQRKGLGISHKTPLFVLGFNKEKNELIVGEHEELFSSEIIVNDINLLAIDNLDNSIVATIKTRYSSKETKGTITKIDENTAKIVFDEAVRGATPGQSAVFYDGDVVIGGGKICQTV